MTANSQYRLVIADESSEVLLPNELTRKQLLLDHPLINGAAISTPPVERAILACKRAFAEGARAFTLLAEPGAGRRCSAQLLMQSLSHDAPTLTVLQHTLSRRDTTTRREEWQSLLFSLQYRNARSTLPVLRDRCLAVVMDAVRRQGGLGLILMLIHNFEFVDNDTASVLFDLRDSLHRVDYQLRFVGVAEHGAFLSRVPALNARYTRAQIDGLVGKPHLLKSIDPEKELTSLLEELDLAEYPATSGCSWLQFFLPKAFDAGLRLQDCAPQFVSAIRTMQAKAGVQPTTRAIFDTIRIVLGQSTMQDNRALQLTEEMWLQALRSACASSSERLLLLQSKGT